MVTFSSAFLDQNIFYDSEWVALNPFLVFNQMYAGSFEAFDQDEFVALKELQLRAVQYIKYQMAFAKDRLKFCLIEDTIQEWFQILIRRNSENFLDDDHARDQNPSCLNRLAGWRFRRPCNV